MLPNLVRVGGLVAMLGGVLGIVLTPILSYLWATYSDTYLYYGRAYFLVYPVWYHGDVEEWRTIRRG